MNIKYVLLSGLLLLSISLANADDIEMTVYKTPTCGCCQKWVDHVEGERIFQQGFSLNNLNTIKPKYNIQGRSQSCHTGVVVTKQGEYVFEGHIPSEHIQRFLDNPPDNAIGLSVPGMPVGSPVVEVGERRDYYEALLIKLDGIDEVFAHVIQMD